MSNILPEGWTFLGDGWTVAPDTADDPNWDLAMSVAQGDYHRDILQGRESLSGSTLKGTAKKWSGKYKKSREAFTNKMTAAGVVWSTHIIGKRTCLVIGKWPGFVAKVMTPTVEGPFLSVDDLFQ